MPGALLNPGDVFIGIVIILNHDRQYNRRLDFMNKLLFILAFIGLTIAPISAQDDIILDAPDGTQVLISRDDFGVPHITGESETGVFFAQGFAAAQDRLVQMITNLYASTGRLSELTGEESLPWDQYIRTYYYTEEERQVHFDGFDPDVQNMLISYAQGVNLYFMMMAEDPENYMPAEIYFFTQMGWMLEPWNHLNTVAIMQFYIRQFGQFGGEELDRMLELQTHGWDWFQENRPLNDPTAPTTIPDDEADGAPVDPAWQHSNFSFDPQVVDQLHQQHEYMVQTANDHNLPDHFGSFAVLIDQIKSATGNVMILGCPQMGEPTLDEPNVLNEVELQCPGLHVGGMSIAGVPLAIIGHTEDFAWSLTSGFTDNTDTYVDTTLDQTMSSYLYNGEWVPVEAIQEVIYIGSNPVPFEHYRTVHGPVIANDPGNQKLFSHKMTFWQEEQQMIEMMYAMVHASDLNGFEEALGLANVSFNVFYADNEQNIKFWHVGKYTDRSDGVDPRLPHLGYGGEEWNGFLPFDALPQLVNPLQTYFVNWNNKPVYWWNNGDNVPYGSSTGYSQNLTNRVNAVSSFVAPIPAFTYTNLKDVPYQIGSHGTYQHAVEFAPDAIIDENIIPPGQSGYIDLTGTPSPHYADQWPLHLNWQFKDQLFGNLLTAEGDVNFDSLVDVLDVVLMVNFVLGNFDPTPAQFDASDLDGDESITVLDIILLVNIIIAYDVIEP